MVEFWGNSWQGGLVVVAGTSLVRATGEEERRGPRGARRGPVVGTGLFRTDPEEGVLPWRDA